MQTEFVRKIVPVSISSDQGFNALVDAIDPMMAPADVLQGLIDDAPCPWSQGWLSGIYAFRQQLAILTDHHF